MTAPKLDSADRALLRLLQTDARLSNAELAERAGLSPSACWRRVRALEEAGVIRRHVAELDPARAGIGFRAIVHVSLIRHVKENAEAFARAVAARPEVRDCWSTTGEADYHLHVACADLAAYNAFLEMLFELPGVSNVRTNLILRDVKTGGPLPL
ncbi:Lrp/AsnC family transcriptional regulator [Oceanicella actignis]|uniref:DNA-binding transcriptional regulator, Lrp family n=1 Tax=Oceanicella actignis TaxID=1189325 RepID=A0A1M7TVK3_9RHOB|nr:Lrp/AsnC family transcriptional regulator [Oceanicella actignis]SES80456.1 DNA-binding transcriptional regulator, Lrp family [Oceanicella actignis]SHN74746.1 DNA-binding transcriptional regulator, Lrp family [Oceanicella actignis]